MHDLQIERKVEFIDDEVEDDAAKRTYKSVEFEGFLQTVMDNRIKYNFTVVKPDEDEAAARESAPNPVREAIARNNEMQI